MAEMTEAVSVMKLIFTLIYSFNYAEVVGDGLISLRPGDKNKNT